jgi:putative ubiquitin-RnfH superfamily antitoxin RatB of RatAB toxin-antitoxin module
MQVGVAYSDTAQQVWLTIEVPDGTVVQDAIQRSGILGLFPGINLGSQKVGVYGRLVKLDAVLRPGDRVEIYRPIIADPQTVPRRDLNDDDDD